MTIDEYSTTNAQWRTLNDEWRIDKWWNFHAQCRMRNDDAQWRMTDANWRMTAAQWRIMNAQWRSLFRHDIYRRYTCMLKRQNWKCRIPCITWYTYNQKKKPSIQRATLNTVLWIVKVPNRPWVYGKWYFSEKIVGAPMPKNGAHGFFLCWVWGSGPLLSTFRPFLTAKNGTFWYTSSDVFDYMYTFMRPKSVKFFFYFRCRGGWWTGRLCFFSGAMCKVRFDVNLGIVTIRYTKRPHSQVI